MKRVVITGAGIVSCIGNSLDEVARSLKLGQSGLSHNEKYEQLGFKAQVSGSIDQSTLNTKAIDRKLKRFLNDASLYAYLSALDAIDQAGLSLEYIADNPRIGIIAGSGGASTSDIHRALDAMRDKGIRGVGAMAIPKTMSSTVSAALATGFKIKGLSYSVSSACATSTHCIGNAVEQIQLNKADIVLAGGGESEHWTQSCMFDGMGAMSNRYNDNPTKASRPYDQNRDGFVISGGGAILVIESLDHAQARGAKILAEIVGYAATSDGSDMVAPSGEGATRCMLEAIQNSKLDKIDYINTHGTSTPVGDIIELLAIQDAFGQLSMSIPPISSTKSMTGHSLGAVGAQEVVYSLLMMENRFIAPSINIDNLDEKIEGFDIVTETREIDVKSILTNSFGFGGTNACLVLKKFDK